MKDIPTPETNAAIELGSDPWELASDLERRLIEMTESKDRISKRAESIRCELVESERRLIACREALADMLMDHKPYGSAQLARFRKANATMTATEPKP